MSVPRQLLARCREGGKEERGEIGGGGEGGMEAEGTTECGMPPLSLNLGQNREEKVQQ